MRSLVLSHTGMTEPLGQSQVLPYLVGLAERGIAVEILSFEPPGTTVDSVEELRTRLALRGIRWKPLMRSPSHGLARKAWEIGTASLHGLAMALERKPDIVHARSYLPAAAADLISTVVPRAKFLFDLRGMLGDEYVDGGNWRENGFRYRMLKIYERRLLRCAGGIVALTTVLHDHLRARGLVPQETPIQVIPCCVDAQRFAINPAARARTRSALNFEGRTVVVYSGTLGSWYMAREMATLVGAFRRRRSDVAWLVLTQSDPSEIVAMARAEGLTCNDLVVRRASPKDVPELLAAGDVGLSLIRPCFSKLGSSPTKVAEYLAAGLTPVVNAGVGDMAELAGERGCVVLPVPFAVADIEQAAARLSALADEPYAQRAVEARAVALRRFSLTDIGIPRYAELYDRMRFGAIRAAGGSPLRKPPGTGAS